MVIRQASAQSGVPSCRNVSTKSELALRLAERIVRELLANHAAPLFGTMSSEPIKRRWHESVLWREDTLGLVEMANNFRSGLRKPRHFPPWIGSDTAATDVGCADER